MPCPEEVEEEVGLRERERLGSRLALGGHLKRAAREMMERLKDGSETERNTVFLSVVVCIP